MAKDPICGMNVQEVKAAATSVYRGTTYYFCGIGCKKTFDKEPEKFVGKTDPVQSKNWFAMYKPIVLIFFYITVISSAVVWNFHLHIKEWMNLFMAQFFLTFSFFKLLDVRTFARSYSQYDIIAKKVKSYGYIYPFIEFLLGIAFIIQYNPLFTNIATLVIMSISIIGVVKSVVNKNNIQCACLGTVFDLPMSSVTIIEDAMMIAMSGAMLLMFN